MAELGNTGIKRDKNISSTISGNINRKNKEAEGWLLLFCIYSCYYMLLYMLL